MPSAPTITPPIDPQVEAAEKAALKSHTSKGEKLFDWLTYGGIGFLGVFAAGIPVGYWAKYGGGAKAFASSIKALEKTGMSAKSAEDIMITNVLMQPGNAALIPIKILENHKPALVEKLNTMMGDKSGDASIDQEPEQTWGSLIKSRLTAWVAVFAGFRGAAMIIGGEKFGEFEDAFSKHVICAPFGKPTHTPGMAQVVENETKLFRAGKIAALDVFATAAATSILYVGSRFFAKNNPRWQAHDIPKEHGTTNDSDATPPANGKTFAGNIAAKPRADGFVEKIARHPTSSNARRAFGDLVQHEPDPRPR